MSNFVTKGMEVDTEPRKVHAVRARSVGGAGWYVEPNRTFCGINLRPFHPRRARIVGTDPDCLWCLAAGKPNEEAGQLYHEADDKQLVPA